MVTLDFAALSSFFATHTSIELAFLFGSYARGQEHALSDVDFAILLVGDPDAHACLTARMDLISDLASLIQFDEVDVAILNESPAALRYRVLRDGKLLFCRDEDVRIAFYLQTVNEYLDFLPILERHQRAILERARRGELTHEHNPYYGALERHRRLRERLNSDS
ncbi:MAG TPA: nucleotidyltransferase domain-containing protein [Anaerolineales bacterium]|nr:nucleotidyltransferase domain-containing protein [Anaerolineales bacterium]